MKSVSAALWKTKVFRCIISFLHQQTAHPYECSLFSISYTAMGMQRIVNRHRKTGKYSCDCLHSPVYSYYFSSSFMEIVVKFNDSSTFNIAFAVSKEVKQLRLFSADTRRIRKPSLVASLFPLDMVLIT